MTTLHEEDATPNPEILEEIVRCGTLAPSSHNTQCWRFKIESDKPANEASITVLPDFSRRCSAVDPDDHHLYATLGCAVENIVVAAPHHGYTVLKVDISSPVSERGIVIHLTCHELRAGNGCSSLYDAIFERQCTRTEYDGKPLSGEEMVALKEACSGYEGVQMYVYSEESTKGAILDSIIEANTEQVTSQEFRNELKSWIRFSEHEATASGDGLYGKCMGSPSAPRWIGGRIFDWVFQPTPENEKIKRQVQSSAGIAVFVSERDDPIHWVQAGRCYERFALQATALGIKNAFLNQPVEVASARLKLAKKLGLPDSSRVDLLVRFGKATCDMPKSFRRPIQSVLVPSSPSTVGEQ